MLMSIVGAIFASILTGTYYYCSEAAMKEKCTENISPARTDQSAPTRPPRKRRSNNGEQSLICNGSTRSESSIGIDHGHATKVVTAQIEKNPNEIGSVDQEHLNLLRRILSSFDVDLASDESALRGSKERSLVTSPNDKHDHKEKALMRKTVNMVTSQNDETERFYLNIPPKTSSYLSRKGQSIDHSLFQINPTIDASTSTKINYQTQELKDLYNEQMIFEKYFYFPDKKGNEVSNSQNDNSRQVVIIQVRTYRPRDVYKEKGKNSRSEILSNNISSFHITNLSASADYANSRGKEYLLKKGSKKFKSNKLSKLFQCHK
ncbi:uncharacterized protein LOC124954078 [Vespa velutina]|uniref:uncharacterized protein LOC124954078 n=1 Tax=Vespa velutina TaxID=202808 RepID=UPI001FB3077A|nr:uncharacterized protein LOC124954078 [Vespa velutina]